MFVHELLRLGLDLKGIFSKDEKTIDYQVLIKELYTNHYVV